MLKKFLALSLGLIICFNSVQDSNAALQVKPGATCLKPGMSTTVSGLKFTCTKVGKKLVWSKGIRIILSTPTPITSASPVTPQVIPPQAPQSPELIVSTIPNVQNQSLPTEYVNGKAYAAIFFRWAPQSNARAYVVRYQNRSTFTPKCDLTVALCEKEQLVDPVVHSVYIKDPSTTFLKVAELSTDCNYGFGFFYLSEGGADLSGIENLNYPKSLSYSVVTPTQGVPSAPEAVIISAIPGNIRVSTSSAPKNGFKIAIYVIGGQFGSGKIAGYLEASGDFLVAAPPGTYIVTTLSVSPSGINGSPGDSITVNVK